MALTQEQVLQRKNYLGGGDCSAVLGLSRFKTPLEVWGEKTGNITQEDISMKMPIRLGNMLEQTVAELFMEETGKKVRRVNETLFHPEFSFIGANIDRRVVGEDSILECKTTSSFGYKAWEGDEIPQEYILQVMHYLAVTGMSKAYIAVLIGNHEFKFKTIEHDKEYIDNIIRKEVTFWKEFVEPKVMPVLFTPNDGDVLFRMFPQQVAGKEITLGEDVDALVEQRASLTAEAKGLEAKIDTIENQIKSLIQDAETATTAKNIITWKTQIANRVDVKRLELEMPDIHAKFLKPSPSRVLRFKANKTK